MNVFSAVGSRVQSCFMPIYASFWHLETPHRQQHDLAREAILNFERGNLSKTEQILEQMTSASREVFFTEVKISRYVRLFPI